MLQTKRIEVVQRREWQQITNDKWLLVWQDGGDPIAKVERLQDGWWHWCVTFTQRSGFAKGCHQAMVATGYPLGCCIP